MVVWCARRMLESGKILGMNLARFMCNNIGQLVVIQCNFEGVHEVAQPIFEFDCPELGYWLKAA